MVKHRMNIDPHVHTNYSDGTASPEDVIKQAIKIGLNGICIADHDTMDGTKQVTEFAKEKGIMLISGVEITTLGGDVLSLGVKKMPRGRNLQEIIKSVHKQKGIAIYAHPFGGFWPKPYTEDDVLVKLFDVIEIFNAGVSLENNVLAMELAKRLKIPGIAGSDAHFLENIGSAFTSVEADTEKNVIDNIKKGNVNVGWI